MYKTVITCISICLLLLIASCDQFGESSQEQTPSSPDQVENLLRKVTEYEVAHQDPIAEQGPSWQLCAFYIGTMEAYKATNDALYHDLALCWVQANNWQYRRPRNADYQCIGQIYLELHLLNPEPNRINATQITFDNILSDPRPGDAAWHWADALFMAPPVLSRLTEATGDTTYLDFMSQQFWEASAPLYDSTHGLYYSDERYIDCQTEHGKDVFWARGNGWVLASLARILQFLPPDHPSHINSRKLCNWRSARSSI